MFIIYLTFSIKVSRREAGYPTKYNMVNIRHEDKKVSLKTKQTNKKHN